MAQKHYCWKIGEQVPEIGTHSLAKHHVFGEYVGRYIRIVAPQPAQRELNLTIVDGFCGGGRYTYQGSIVPGSPLVLLRAVRATEAELDLNRQHGFRVKAEFFFVDKLEEHIEFLQAELSTSEFKQDVGNSIHLTPDTFESQASSIIEFIRAKGSSHRSLFFLDQYGWSDVSFSVIRDILAN
jgi:three-Cys-motif partner protein